VFIHAFQESNPIELIELLGVENTMWGSDFPHPEGMADPLAYSDAVEDLDAETQALIMGGSLARIMKVDA
jgi:predicted TIM-barrel fold metal-dependent hydrolase